MNRQSPQSPFWEALERFVAQEAVQAEWRQALGPSWRWARALLRPTGELAASYPKLDPRARSWSRYRVVCHSADAQDYVGVCPDGTGSVPLTREQLSVHRLDHAGLAAGIAAALRLAPDFRESEDPPHLWRVGMYTSPRAGEFHVYLAIPPDSANLAHIVASLTSGDVGPVVLLTSTRRYWRQWPEALRRSGSRVAALGEVLKVTVGGELVALAPMSVLCGERTPRAPSGRLPAGREEDRRDGCYGARTVVYRGREYVCELTVEERAFLQRALVVAELDVHELMHPTAGLVFQERYVNTRPKRHKIAQFLSRLSGRLSRSDPGLRVQFALQRGTDFVVRRDPPDA
jgi:hypothetical protein